jgi:hypothetical protein
MGSKSQPSNGPSHHEPGGPPANPADLALAEAKRALARGGSPADVIEPTYGLTRMHVAARDGHVKLLRFLVDQGGDVYRMNQTREIRASRRPISIRSVYL